VFIQSAEEAMLPPMQIDHTCSVYSENVHREANGLGRMVSGHMGTRYPAELV
jgi:hypothetical protein